MTHRWPEHDEAGTHSTQGCKALAAVLVQQLVMGLAGLCSQGYAFRLILAEPQASLQCTRICMWLWLYEHGRASSFCCLLQRPAQSASHQPFVVLDDDSTARERSVPHLEVVAKGRIDFGSV